MTFLVLDKLTKRFGDQVAVDALSLAVAKGEFVAVLGPSGCGKTTTLQMIAGFVEPTSGAIQLDGEDLLSVRPARRGLGIVFQSYALFPHMTAAENVAFGLEMQGVGKAERERQVAAMLDLVGLAKLAGRFPRRMSGGQQQRVALARALVIRPRILLLDEPLSNLDAKLREEMQIELRQIQRTLGTTTILVTHDQGEAMALADRIVVLNQGRAEQIAAPHEAYERPATPFVGGFLGKTNVLEARVEAHGAGVRLAIGEASWHIERPLRDFEPHRRAVIVVRPEKVVIGPAGGPGLPGVVKVRVFQGSHWLLQVVHASGVIVTVIQQNTGEAPPGEGAAVALNWRAENMRAASVEGVRR